MEADCINLNSAGTAYTVKTVSTLDELENLARDWERITQISGIQNVFATFEWFRTWCECLTRERTPDFFRPNVLVVEQFEQVIAVVPLIFRKTITFGVPLRRLEFLDGDYNDIALSPIRDSQVMCAIADHLALDADHWDVINLINLHRKDDISRFQNALLNCSLPFQLVPELEGSPYLVLETGSSAIMQRISAQGRRKLRKEIEAAASAGMKVRIIENPENEYGLINKLADLEQKKCRFLKVEPFISRYPKEFQSLVNTMGPRRLLYIALLEQEETPIAFQLGFRCGSKLWGYVGAYDPSFARSSPGKLLLSHIWDYGCSHGYDEFDFLSGEEPYKMRWSTGCREKFRMRIWNRHYISRFDKWLYENVKSLFQNTTSSFRRG